MTEEVPSEPGEPPRPRGTEAIPLRETIADVIFGAETPMGRLFDVILLWVIVASVVAVLLESVSAFEAQYGALLRGLEWTFTVLFTIEYGLRLYSARNRLRYALSFFGIVDLLSLLPTFLGIFFSGMHSLLVIRALRLLRVFRVLKVMRHMGEANHLMRAIRASVPKISVFLGAVLIIAVIVGATMYVVEDPKDGFTSVPRSMYWAIVTMTTVGYGDIAPQTVLGQSIAAMLMVVGYGIIAVPTGIVSAEFVGTKDGQAGPVYAPCDKCGTPAHDADANFCHVCGERID